ncbi:hypothetical protein L1887_27829 [Cichorium endivia]|nr:hypothetical protein L1887_27829 [Cichorium endivia]
MWKNKTTNVLCGAAKRLPFYFFAPGYLPGVWKGGDQMLILGKIGDLPDFVGPAIPHDRDGETNGLCRYAHCMEANCSCKSENGEFSSTVTISLHSGFYHNRYIEFTKELIRETEIPTILSDYCEEACHLAANCISSVTGSPPTIPVQLNPFRQPLAVEDTTLIPPCYSNCFLFGI